jgi:hypothetical protein
MSDTPETDASVFDAEANGIIYKCVFAAFASQLERERNSLQDQRDFCMGEIERLRKERDEARGERDEWIARFRADEQLIKEAMEKHE